MLILQNISYKHSNKDVLFHNINLTINKNNKIALIGNNGSGKSTLLKLIAGDLQAYDGQIHTDAKPYYIPQIYGQFNHLNIAQVLGVETKLNALKEILNGNVSDENFTLLNEDWTIEERCQEALEKWKLSNFDLDTPMKKLSGGQKTKVFLAGIFIHQPKFILMDEPSNHLDKEARTFLYNFIEETSRNLIIVSHDRKLLNLLDTICELDKRGITVYGGNYEFYETQKNIENNALFQDVKSKEKSLRKAKEKERETAERQQKLDARGKKKQEKAGVARIMMNTLKNNAEKSTSKLKIIHADKIGNISNELLELRQELPDMDKMKFGFDSSKLHKGKVLFKASDLNISFQEKLLWKQPLHIEITSGERILLEGANGSGKTTLIKIILGVLETKNGKISKADFNYLYIDQDYSLITNQLTVYEQAQQFNASGLEEHEIKTRLNRFLFAKNDWDKPCLALSGGEKMRLMICCLNIQNQSPDLIVLDEPTNNLDMQNIEILKAAINDYKGTLLLVSHDEYFCKAVNVERSVELGVLKSFIISNQF